jgi:hypothetical protein
MEATAATLPITIPAIGPPPNPLFEAVEVTVAVGTPEDVGEGLVVDEEEVELARVSWPPSLVVVLSRTETV